jgi:hypothetical protein
MDSLISKLANEQQPPSAEQLGRIARYVAAAPFAEDLLVVDRPLWGGFWQGDVIAPGYQLPAVELALLRAVRLDKNWPEDITVPQFLADLRQTILDPQARVWTLAMAGEPWLVFAASATNRKSKIQNPKSVTVVWYCAATGRLHAGYRTKWNNLILVEAITQQPAGTVGRQNRGKQSGWLEEVIKQREVDEAHDLAVRLDTAILRFRLG